MALIEADKRGATVDVMERQELLGNPELPQYLKQKLSKPASEASHIPASSDGAFWVVAAFDDLTR